MPVAASATAALVAGALALLPAAPASAAVADQAALAGTVALPTAATPYEDVFDTVTGLLYVADPGSSTVDVVYTSSATAASTGGRFRTTAADGTAVDPEAGAVVAQFAMANKSFGLSIDPSSGVLYSSASAAMIAEAVEIDPSSDAYGTVLWSADLTSLGKIREVYVDASGDHLYVSSPGAAAVAVLDTADGELLATWSAKTGADDTTTTTTAGIAEDTTEDTLYLANLSGSVTVLDATDGSFVTQIATTQASPTNVAYDPVTEQVFVADQAGYVEVVDADASSSTYNTVVATTEIGTDAGTLGVTVDDVAGVVYAANYKNATVSVLDAATGEVTSTLAVGTNPIHTVVDPATHLAYVTNKASASLSVVDPGYVAPVPTVVADPSSVQAGGTVTLTGTGFTAGQVVQAVKLDAGTIIGGGAKGTTPFVTADASGSFTGTVTVPAGTAAGAHVLNVLGSTPSVISLTVAITVTEAAPVVEGTALTVAAPTSVKLGAPATVTGTLTTTDGTAVSGAKVSLQAKASGATKFTTVKTVTSGAKGKVTAVVTPTRTTTYRWVYAGDATHAAVTSATDVVKVPAVTVTAHLVKTSVAKGSKAVVKGTVGTVSRKVTVTLQRRTASGAWVNVKHVSTKGAFSFSVKQTATGTVRYRVHVPALAGHAAKNTAVLVLRVHR